jgi:hypothetical protein
LVYLALLDGDGTGLAAVIAQLGEAFAFERLRENVGWI